MKTREQIPILDLVEQYVDLSKRGTSERPYYVGLCPFHDDSSPSFVVYPNINRAICFACYPEGMDSIGFIRNLKGLTYKEALEAVTHELSDTDAFAKYLKEVQIGDKYDLVPFAIRMQNVMSSEHKDRFEIFEYVVQAVLNGNMYYANKILSGVKDARP